MQLLIFSGLVSLLSDKDRKGVVLLAKSILSRNVRLWPE
jgi:hypothetical protein